MRHSWLSEALVLSEVLEKEPLSYLEFRSTILNAEIFKLTPYLRESSVQGIGLPSRKIHYLLSSPNTVNVKSESRNTR